MGNRDIAKYLLKKGARKDILCADMLGESDVVRALVKADPDIVKVRGPHGLTLFYHAAINADIELAEFLFKNGADGVASALHSAAREGDEVMVRWLLDHGGADNVNIRPIANQTALEIAVKRKRERIVDLLKQYGA